MPLSAKVLMIDDDADCRASVRHLLESTGYTVVEAECGKDGLRRMVEHRPDVILLDVMMECASEGYSVTQAIKHQDCFSDYRGIPVIMLSSIQESPDELFPMSPESELIRPDRYIPKPVDAGLLLGAIESVLAARKPPAV
ncbi:MAG: response regulator [Bryobacterales bacterium]|nr:response regulator [Bryobacterales bacterium]